LERIDNPEKNWKLSVNDVKERQFWDDYMKVYFEMMKNTSTQHAPWYIIPADNKWFSRVAIGEILIEKLKSLNLNYPKLNAEQTTNIKSAKLFLKKKVQKNIKNQKKNNYLK